MNNLTPPALHITGLSLAYPNETGTAHLALDSISLTVAPGQIFGLLGLPGSGKTSLLRAAAGRIAAQSGHIAIFGRAQTLQPDPCLAAWLQDDPLPDPSQVLDTDGKSVYSEDLSSLAAALGIDPPALAELSRLPHTLQERARLIPLLLDSRPLLLLDELPGLNPATAALLGDWLPDHFHAHGQTLVLATHSPAILHKLCDRAAVFQKGKIVYAGAANNPPGPITKSIYHVRLGGRLDGHSAARPAWPVGLSIQADGDDTLITGEFADQSALYGLINFARDLGLTILSIQMQAPDPLDAWQAWMERG